MKPIRVVFKKLGRSNAHGLAGDYVELDPRLKGLKLCEILNHEVFHILFPTLSEEEIEKASIRYTLTAWKFGLRRVDNDEKCTFQDGTCYKPKKAKKRPKS